jgi:hypothetical protein
MVLIGFGPEEGEEAIAPVKASRGSRGKVGE